MMGCLQLKTKRIGGMTLNVALACPVGLGKWEYLMVEDGMLTTSKGEKILVRKKNKT